MKKVLCIDDSKAVHAFLKNCLENEPFHLTSVFNGHDALTLLSTNNSENHFELIFLDWEMPGMNGPEVYDNIRLLKIKTPVIMVTSKNDMENISLMLNKGASEYVLKPFTKDILLQKINSVFSGF